MSFNVDIEGINQRYKVSSQTTVGDLLLKISQKISEGKLPTMNGTSCFGLYIVKSCDQTRNKVLEIKTSTFVLDIDEQMNQELKPSEERYKLVFQPRFFFFYFAAR
eukprot:TRINITY_DN2793_c0_g1_i1.p1 TRINITY_DN2793_c0_g1~~TRINITY_DN2793_c0_g1_i1.p1  ORF type:complete len:106 (-),score=16.30 TRINITY_DN2793_c0_g1_i1:115-432(-)